MHNLRLYNMAKGSLKKIRLHGFQISPHWRNKLDLNTQPFKKNKPLISLLKSNVPLPQMHTVLPFIFNEMGPKSSCSSAQMAMNSATDFSKANSCFVVLLCFRTAELLVALWLPIRSISGPTSTQHNNKRLWSRYVYNVQFGVNAAEFSTQTK